MEIINCWDFRKCGRGPEGERVGELGLCPAATTTQLNGMNGGMNGGRICWFVAGTACDGMAQTVAQKFDACMKCEFYEIVKKHKIPTTP